MRKTVPCWLGLLLLASSCLEGKPEIRTWSVTIEGGWQGSLSLYPKTKDGVERGSLFYLFAERDILWQEDADTIIVTYRTPWRPLDKNPPGIRFQKGPDSIVPMPDGLESGEYKALAASPWKSGGPEPGQLSGSSPATPYSKAHHSGNFILDVSTIPAPLARHALRVFDDDETHLMPLIRHPELSPETLTEFWKSSDASLKENVDDSRSNRILHALLANPNLPKDLLLKIWENSYNDNPFTGDLPYRASRHPAAEPEWFQTILRKLSEDGKQSDLLRDSLEDEDPLPPEALDQLIRWSIRPGKRVSSKLAPRKDLSQAQIEVLFTSGGESLVSRKDFPLHLFAEAASSESFETRVEIVRNPAAPPDVVQQVMREFYEKPVFGRMSGPFDLYLLLAEHQLLPADLQLKLATHIAPDVRQALANNPSLSLTIRKQLAADPFACVALAARDALGKEPAADTTAFLESLPALESLNPAGNFHEASDATLKADDPSAFRLYHEALVGTQYPNSYWTGSMVEMGAIRCIQDQMETGNLKATSLAYQAFHNGWTPQMTDLTLGKKPDPDTIEAFALSVVQRGRAEDLESLETRSIDLGFVRESPLVWYAVARRDEVLLKRLLSLHADPLVPKDGITPAQLAVSVRFMSALDTLPLDAAARAELEAFHKRFPGNPKAPWLGDWTNGKSEFQTLGLRLLADGTGIFFTAIGIGIPVGWVQPDPSKSEFEIIAFDEAGKEQPPMIEARFHDVNLTLKLDGRDETFGRPKPEE